MQKLSCKKRTGTKHKKRGGEKAKGEKHTKSIEELFV